MDWDADWQTVRRRRRQRTEAVGATGHPQQDFGAFAALETDPAPSSSAPDQAGQQKKKRNRKKGGTVAPAPASPAPPTAAASPKPVPAASTPTPPALPNPKQLQPHQPTSHASTPTPPAAASLLAWLRSLLHWLLPFLFKCTAPTTTPTTQPGPPASPKNKPQAEQPQQDVAATPADTGSGHAADVKTPSKPANAKAGGCAPSNLAAVVQPTAAAASEPTTPSASQQQQPPPSQAQQGEQQQQVQRQAAAEPRSTAARAAPLPQQQQQHHHHHHHEQRQQPRDTVAAASATATGNGKAAAPRKPRTGTYLLQQLPGSFDDVVGGVAISGDLMACSSYDGNVQLFCLPNSGAPGAAGPRLVRHLSGHTGRVCAVAAQASAGRVVTAGQDSLLKVWRTGADRASAKEASSHYLYESVTCIAADWSAGSTLLGGRSGAGLLWDLEAGRRLQALKGHGSEVSAAARGGQGPHMVFTASRDGAVKAWDTRQAATASLATLSGFRGRVCSLAPCCSLLYAGDQSSTVKVFDLRSTGSCLPARELPNAPRVAGEACPVTGLGVDAAGGRLLSSAAAWWSDDPQAMTEAPYDAEWPVAAVNIFRGGGAGAEQYLETVRVGGMAPLSCMAVAEDGRVAAGDVLGGVALLWPGDGLGEGTGAAAAGGDWESLWVRGAAVGLVELVDSSSEGEGNDCTSEAEDGGDEDQYY